MMKMTSFTAIPSLLQCAAINQNGGNFSNFKVFLKKEEFLQKCLKLYDKKFDTKTRKRVSRTLNTIS